MFPTNTEGQNNYIDDLLKMVYIMPLTDLKLDESNFNPPRDIDFASTKKYGRLNVTMLMINFQNGLHRTFD